VSLLYFPLTISYTKLLAEFADVLEQLESAFYQQALSKFKEADFTAAGFASSQVAVEQFTTIQIDEATHSTVLQVIIYSISLGPPSNFSF